MPFQGDAPEGGGHILMAAMRGNRVGGKLADEMRRGKKIPLVHSIGLMHRNRVTLWNCMTVISAWWRSHRPFQKIAEVTHPDRPDIGRNCGGVEGVSHISALEFEGNIRPTNWNRRQLSWKIGRSWRRDVVRKSHTRPEGAPREALMSWGSREDADKMQ